jgi:sigma-B regulation protein RsbU (phosphoserine phosphatase)
MGMIPHDFSALERDFGVELAGVLEPAREVGGDLYGAFPSASGRLVIFVGDVSGKGIPASLFMVRASSLARLLGRDDAEPERILARLNDELSADNPSGMFVTMVCAVYDPRTGRVALANAGHNRPLLLSYGTAPRWAVDRLGTALGFEPGLRFERTELELKPGDALVFYTDGVNEAFNPEGECYGNTRLLRESAEFAAQPAAVVSGGLLGQVRTFAAGAQQSDDIAILVLRPGDRPAALVPRLGTLCLDLPATAEDVMRAVAQLQAFGREHGVDERTLFGLAVALEECAANIVRHACDAPGDHQFQVRFERNAEGLELELIDRGPAFDPTTAAVPDLGVGEQLSPNGGWGIHLARHYSDKISYRRSGDENILRLSKGLVPRRT